MRLASVAAHFGRDIDRSLEKMAGIVADARSSGVELLVFPDATLGGYLSDLRHPDAHALPPALTEDSFEIGRVIAMAGDMVVCFGYTEDAVVDDVPVHFNAAVCVTGDGVLGRHRKVHQPAGEALAYRAGESFAAFDTPVGRMGMLIDYDKTFPEAARSLALDGAHVVACLSAWPASVTDRASRLPQDRQSRLFDIYDSARAAENQVVWVSSNLTGTMGGLRFLGQAKIVGPGGDVLASTGVEAGLAVAGVDIDEALDTARRSMFHLRDRRPDTYSMRAPAHA